MQGGGSNMSAYIGQLVIDNTFTYAYVIGKRPDLKVGIDAYLTANGSATLITS
jgi:hypothetical protein